MTEYAILARAPRCAPPARYAWAFALTVAYAATRRVAPDCSCAGRHGSPVDVAIDAIGALIGLWRALRI